MKTLKNLSLALLVLATVNTQLQADEDTPAPAKAVATPFALFADGATLGQAHATDELYNGQEGETRKERLARERKERDAKRKQQKQTSTSNKKKMRIKQDEQNNMDASL